MNRCCCFVAKRGVSHVRYFGCVNKVQIAIWTIFFKGYFNQLFLVFAVAGDD